MHTTGSMDVLHLVGFLTGAVLYGLLLSLVTRTTSRPDPFALATALLGLGWNLGELGTLAGREMDWDGAVPWLSAAAYTGLGLLASVVVHSAARAGERGQRATAVLVYGGAALAGVLHLRAAAAGEALPSSAALTWLTVALGAAVPFLLLSMRGGPHSRRALWLVALALVAVSVLHLGRFHGAQESWPIELVGHHASMLLAFALLYQDFRFAFADLFLKQALTLLALVAVVGAGYASVAPWLHPQDGAIPPTVIGLLLTMWTGTALVFPMLRRAVTVFVDRALLERQNYRQLIADLTGTLPRLDTVDDVLAHTATVAGRALTASRVWSYEADATPPSDPVVRAVRVETGEAPQYVLAIGPLAGGRRLLSDDIVMLDRAALETARRIDALRLTGERYERMLQEREMRSLASEAELRALRAQINPHFLFNALTTITYLIQFAPQRARTAVQRLTTLLRAVLKPDAATTTLGRERELVECYLQIEHERFEERLEYIIDIPDRLADLPMPSLLVQPLVENAIKHGISGAADGGVVAISARLGVELVIEVRNTGLPLGASTVSHGFGLGLQNVERRLHHHYGAGASVELTRSDDGATIARLRVPRAAMGGEVSARALAREMEL